ncbi:MAG: PDZ domain-containing protein [Acidobacteriota bacterium]|nr:PDZ domain-containing protein [Acidobacteriota bacterium]
MNLAITTKASPAAAGVGGGTGVLLGRIQSLQLGRFTLEKPVTSFAQSTKGVLANKGLTGNIGGGILRRFKVIFNYPDRRMILEPNSRFTEPFESDMSGTVLIAEGAELDIRKVFYVTENSPTSEAGLRVGGIITAIDGKPSSALTLDDIREKFKQNGREYLLSVERGEQSLQIKIKLRGLI